MGEAAAPTEPTSEVIEPFNNGHFIIKKENIDLLQAYTSRAVDFTMDAEVYRDIREHATYYQIFIFPDIKDICRQITIHSPSILERHKAILDAIMVQDGARITALLDAEVQFIADMRKSSEEILSCIKHFASGCMKDMIALFYSMLADDEMAEELLNQAEPAITTIRMIGGFFKLLIDDLNLLERRIDNSRNCRPVIADLQIEQLSDAWRILVWRGKELQTVVL